MRNVFLATDGHSRNVCSSKQISQYKQESIFVLLRISTIAGFEALVLQNYLLHTLFQYRMGSSYSKYLSPETHPSMHSWLLLDTLTWSCVPQRQLHSALQTSGQCRAPPASLIYIDLKFSPRRRAMSFRKQTQPWCSFPFLLFGI